MPTQVRILLPPLSPLGHQTWFEDPAGFHSDWGFVGETETVVLLVGALLLTIVVRLASRWWNGVDVPFLAAMAPYMPFAVRLHLTVCLVGLLGLGVYLSPAMDLEWDLAGILLGAVMALVAIGMATGYRARRRACCWSPPARSACSSSASARCSSESTCWVSPLFVWFAGPGRWSADHDAATPPSRRR